MAATREEKLAALKAARGKDDSEEARQKTAEKVVELKQKVGFGRLYSVMLMGCYYQSYWTLEQALVSRFFAY